MSGPSGPFAAGRLACRRRYGPTIAAEANRRQPCFRQLELSDTRLFDRPTAGRRVSADDPRPAHARAPRPGSRPSRQRCRAPHGARRTWPCSPELRPQCRSGSAGTPAMDAEQSPRVNDPCRRAAVPSSDAGVSITAQLMLAKDDRRASWQKQGARYRIEAEAVARYDRAGLSRRRQWARLTRLRRAAGRGAPRTA
jgi:hypothetical protein